MTFSVRSALDAIVTLEAGLSITSPVAMSIKKAYKTFPRQSGAVPDAPCFINIPRLVNIGHFAGSRQQLWQVRMQLLIREADNDQGADIVLAFVEKLLDAMSAAITLHGLPVILNDITSTDVTSLEYANQAFPGIEITATYKVPLEAVTVAA